MTAGSTPKRKEQNRVAQREFRKRQKAYYREMEISSGHMRKEIEQLSKTNKDLVAALSRLQKENISLKALRSSSILPQTPLFGPDASASSSLTSPIDFDSSAPGSGSAPGSFIAPDDDEPLIDIHEARKTFRAPVPVPPTPPKPQPTRRPSQRAAALNAKRLVDSSSESSSDDMDDDDEEEGEGDEEMARSESSQAAKRGRGSVAIKEAVASKKSGSQKRLTVKTESPRVQQSAAQQNFGFEMINQPNPSWFPTQLPIPGGGGVQVSPASSSSGRGSFSNQLVSPVMPSFPQFQPVYHPVPHQHYLQPSPTIRDRRRMNEAMHAPMPMQSQLGLYDMGQGHAGPAQFQGRRWTHPQIGQMGLGLAFGGGVGGDLGGGDRVMVKQEYSPPHFEEAKLHVQPRQPVQQAYFDQQQFVGSNGEVIDPTKTEAAHYTQAFNAHGDGSVMSGMGSDMEVITPCFEDGPGARPGQIFGWPGDAGKMLMANDGQPPAEGSWLPFT